jgi:uncharacterized RDD family membrane protein YckC
MSVEGDSYAGFWIRFAAFLIDSILVAMVIAPLLTAIYGADYWALPTGAPEATGSLGKFRFWDFLLTYVLPAVAFIMFWIYRSATPGKMCLRLSIVDANTGGKPSTGQLIGRYLGYYVSMLPLMLGFIWVGLDRRKQGWHDKLAGTLVVRGRKET